MFDLRYLYVCIFPIEKYMPELPITKVSTERKNNLGYEVL